jgi:MarR family transcriptional regulator, organic hydroperoxide resistance regulator
MMQSMDAHPVAEFDVSAVTTALPDALQFMRLLWALVHGLDRTSKRMFDEIGVTGPQRLVLRVVGLFPGLSAGDLAAVLHMHPSTLTGVLKRLVTQRLITRSNASHDQRRAVLHLSPLGARINSAHRGTVESAVSDALRGISARDRAATKRVLERITGHFDVSRGRRRGVRQTRPS